MEKFQVNSQERAIQILNSKEVVSTAGTYKAKHRVSKNVFDWEDGSGQYRIVNTNLMNSYQKKEVVSLLQDQKFQEATNKGLTFRASLDLSDELDSAIESTVLVEDRELSSGETALLITKIRPIGAVKGDKFNFSDVFMTSAPEIKTPEAETVA
jgi:hypothetical protein